MSKEPTADERVAILLEEMRSNFKAVLEKVQDADKKNEQRINEFKREIVPEVKDIKTALKTLSKDVAEIKSEFPYAKNILLDHEHRIKDLESKAS